MLNESRQPEAVTRQFLRWFWALLERLVFERRQALLYFWMGAPLLPYAPAQTLSPAPSIVLRPPDAALPTANTCISRLYLPLYGDKHTLRLKLLTAIQTSSFGFV